MDEQGWLQSLMKERAKRAEETPEECRTCTNCGHMDQFTYYQYGNVYCSHFRMNMDDGPTSGCAGENWTPDMSDFEF